MSDMKISDAGIAAIKEYEGCVLTAYPPERCPCVCRSVKQKRR